MKNLIAFVKRYWKVLLGVLGIGIGAVIAAEVAKGNSRPSPKYVEPDVKKETDAAIKANAEAKVAIDTKATEDKAKVDALTTPEAVAILDNGTQVKIDAIKQEATTTAVDSIMDRIKKESANG